MEKTRIRYIDQLKALAITFVVLGHVAGCMGADDTPFTYLGASFHMPLFMFLSGMFALKEFRWDVKSVCTFLQKKAIRVILPFIVIGGAYSVMVEHNVLAVVDGTFGGFWFMPALFLCMIMGLCFSILRYFVGGGKIKNIFVQILLAALIWGLFSLLWIADIPVPYLLNALKLFPYFILGDFYRRYQVRKLMYLRNNLVQTSAILLYVTTMAFTLCSGFHFINLTGVFAIIILMGLFDKYQNHMPSWIDWVGQRSLEVYLLHWFFLPDLQMQLKSWVCTNDFNSNFVVTAVFSLLITIPVMVLCFVVAAVIRQSEILNFFCFGIRDKRK